jgi:hypothetical protein
VPNLPPAVSAKMELSRQNRAVDGHSCCKAVFSRGSEGALCGAVRSPACLIRSTIV